jgi:competence protein ComEC
MATAHFPAGPAVQLAARGPTGPPPRPAYTIWQGPLVPIALAGTAGIVLDRYAGTPLVSTLFAAVAGLIAWAIASSGRSQGLALVYLWGSIAALGAAYHHYWREGVAADDIGHFASADPQPILLRGVLESEPTIVWRVRNDPLRSFERSDSTRAVFRARRLKQRDDWQLVSGLAQLTVYGHLKGVHVGDEVEIVGRLLAPQGPANPGEFDYASFLQDQGIRALVTVQKTPEGVIRIAEHWPWTIGGWLAVIRVWGQETLEQTVAEEQSGVAMALLLGDGSTMTGEDWEKYIKTGVIHVLAISGQHLVVLAAFLWGTLRLLGLGGRRGAWLVAFFLLGYALLAGGRPPVLRSAVTVCVFCGSLVLRRQAMPANSFALAWIVVALLNPTDVFNAGCQLSFLSVAVLYWGIGSGQQSNPDGQAGRWGTSGLLQPLLHRPDDPLLQLIEDSRPTWQRGFRWCLRQVMASYILTLAIWLAIAPLVAARYQLVSFAGIVLGPPIVALTSVALLSGFLLLLVAPFCLPLAYGFGWVTSGCLAVCDWLVHGGENGPLAYWYVGRVPEWWLWVFYPALLAVLTMASLRRRWMLLAGLAWLCTGLAAGAVRQPSDEFRCTFLAVGHGGCTVLETPDGRTLLYDTGAIGGPDVTRRQIAPFLWHRGIKRVDEVLLSHADLDHFNGLTALIDRFAVGQITCTPTFADKTTAGVQHTLATLQRRGIPIRIVHAGDRLGAGKVHLDVLHPPAVGPQGNENARSMVLLVRHRGHSLLLTGDLEGPGLERVLALPKVSVDVLMAPHHGSRLANKPELAAWARPRIVVSCQEPPRRPALAQEPYSERGATFLATWAHGAVSFRSQRAGLIVETFLTGQRWIVRGLGRP